MHKFNLTIVLYVIEFQSIHLSFSVSYNRYPRAITKFAVTILGQGNVSRMVFLAKQPYWSGWCQQDGVPCHTTILVRVVSAGWGKPV